MPGRRDTGRIWQSCLDVFLRAYGLRQLVSDRQVWVQDSLLGIIIYHDHVDDSRLTTTAAGVLQHFHRAWALRFGESLTLAERSEDFTGLCHHPTEYGTVAVSCDGVIERLGALIAHGLSLRMQRATVPCRLPPFGHCATPHRTPTPSISPSCFPCVASWGVSASSWSLSAATHT